MNKMSEDEAIKQLQYLKNRKIGCGDWLINCKDRQAIETILDLYKQEKDSNQWLLKAFDESRNNNIELAKECCKIQEELKQEKEKNKELIERNKALSNNMLSLACNSVRKDKIREYRKQFIKDNKKEKTFMTQSSQINASLIKFC